jgi:hypothetical protein
MASREDKPSIPPALAVAFADAVLAYELWSPRYGTGHIGVKGSGYYTIRQVCDQVAQFTDPLPDHVHHRLMSYMQDTPHGKLKAMLLKRSTYATGTLCLRGMMDIKEARIR